MITSYDPTDAASMIAWLASLEQECPCIYSGSLCTSCELRNEEYPNQEWDECPKDCYSCAGTGRIVPFVALRIVKVAVWSHRDCKVLGHCDLILPDTGTVLAWGDCEGRGWLPEPDLERACWRVHRVAKSILFTFTDETEVEYLARACARVLLEMEGRT